MFVLINDKGEFRGRDGQWVRSLHEAQVCDTAGQAKREQSKYHEDENVVIHSVEFEPISEAKKGAKEK